MGTPGVKWMQLFLMYLHPWKPAFTLDLLSVILILPQGYPFTPTDPDIS